MSDLVIVARFSSRPECLIAQSLLSAAGIETLMPDFNVLMADYDPSMMEHGWRLMGRSEDVPEIERVLAEAQAEAARESEG
jgi:hypothetical protein